MAVPDQPPAQFEFAHFNGVQLDSQRPASTKSPFLFIVKTPSSGALSRSTTRSAAASINSHAQRWAQEVASSKTLNKSGAPTNMEPLPFEDCVSRCRVDRLLADDSKSTRSRRNSSRKGTSQPGMKRRKASTPQPPDEPSATDSHDGSSTAENILDPELEQQDNMRREEDSGQSPRMVLSVANPLSALDPFNCASLSLDADAQPILQYYLSFVLSSTPPGQETPTADSALVRHYSTINAIMQGCMRESVHMYALLAATASRMRRVSHVSFRPDNGPEIYLHKALQCLRALLDNYSATQDRQIILDIYYLSVCGWYMENYEASKLHFDFLKHFWRALPPGQSSFDQYIYDMLSYNAMFLGSDDEVTSTSETPPALGHNTTATLLLQSSPSPSSSHHLWKRQYSYGHCSAFPFALESTSYSQELKDIISELPPLLRLHRYMHQKSELVGAETDWVRSKSKSLASRLLESPSYGSELCCRLALALLLRQVSESTNKLPVEVGRGSSSPPDRIKADDSTTRIIQRLKRQLQYEMLLPSNEIPTPEDYYGGVGVGVGMPTSSSLSRSHSHSSTSTFSSPSPSSSPSSSSRQPNSNNPSLPNLPPSSTTSQSQIQIWTGTSNTLLLWILTTGLFVTRIHALQTEYDWFRPRVVPLMQLLKITTIQQLRDLMWSFVCVDGMLDDAVFGALARRRRGRGGD